MKNKEKRTDTSPFWSDIDVIYISKRILKRDFIKLKTVNLLSLCVGVALSIGFSAVTYFSFVAEGITLWTALSFLAGLLFLLETVFSLKDLIYKIKKINRNEFVLAEAKMRHLFEDTSTAEGPDFIGDSYVTYFCKACKDKTIKIKVHGTSANKFSENTKVFAAFFCKNGNIEEKPFMLLLGKDYQIEEGITII